MQVNKTILVLLILGCFLVLVLTLLLFLDTLVYPVPLYPVPPPFAWHERVDMIYYINLDSRTDRKQQILSVLQTDLDVPAHKIQRIPAVKSNPGFKGCAQSHFMAMEKAMEHNYRCVCILEDDFMPMVDTQTFSNHITNIKDDFDVLMLGMTPIKIKKYRNNTYRIQASLGMPGYIVHRKYFSTLSRIFKEAMEKGVPIDLQTQLYQPRHTWIGFYPPIARQRPGFSDIEQRHTDYSYLEIDGKMLTIL